MFNHTAQKGVNIRIISASGKKSNHRKGGAVLMEFVGGCVFIHLIFFSFAGYMLGSDVDTTQYMPVFYCLVLQMPPGKYPSKHRKPSSDMRWWTMVNMFSLSHI